MVVTRSKLKRILQPYLKKKPDQINHLFSGQPVYIKKRIEQTLAKKYVSAFKNAGAICSIEQVPKRIRVLTPQDNLGNIRYPVQQCPFLSNAVNGINFNRADMESVPFKNIISVSVFLSSAAIGKQVNLIFFIKGYLRPFSAEAERIRYNEFPNIVAETVFKSLRKFIWFIYRQNDGIAVDVNTYEYLTGNMPVQIHNPTHYINAIGTALGNEGLTGVATGRQAVLSSEARVAPEKFQEDTAKKNSSPPVMPDSRLNSGHPSSDTGSEPWRLLKPKRRSTEAANSKRAKVVETGGPSAHKHQTGNIAMSDSQAPGQTLRLPVLEVSTEVIGNNIFSKFEPLTVNLSAQGICLHWTYSEMTFLTGRKSRTIDMYIPVDCLSDISGIDNETTQLYGGDGVIGKSVGGLLEAVTGMKSPNRVHKVTLHFHFPIPVLNRVTNSAIANWDQGQELRLGLAATEWPELRKKLTEWVTANHADGGPYCPDCNTGQLQGKTGNVFGQLLGIAKSVASAIPRTHAACNACGSRFELDYANGAWKREN